MKDMISYRGLNCEKCDAYLASFIKYGYTFLMEKGIIESVANYHHTFCVIVITDKKEQNKIRMAVAE